MTAKKQRPTLQNIADQVGVTKMTVSRYLRDPEKVSAVVGEKIAKAVEELGYVPNRAPDILSKAKSYSIGVLLPSLTNQVFDEVLRGIETVIEPLGYQAMLAHYGYSKEIEEKRIETLLSYNVDGIILSESFHTERSKRMLKATGVPVVEIMDSASPPLQQAVGFDNYAASVAITKLMLSKDRTNIAYLAARMDVRTKQKIKGFEQTIEGAGLSPLVISTKQASSYSVGSELFRLAKEKNPQLDGIYCTNDDLAIGALFECLRQGIKVPEDMSIVGFHGHNIASVVSPTLATVITPREEMGKIAADQLLKRILNPNEPITERVIELQTEIFLGESL
ncbi:gluconate operon transcriptional repressor GntR [Vibrio algarum]|uniref:Gluconate operon transcriptional repressor GntR n=1 Tax=Vibrio algarum TaxID=3020714 RepID=A0ABT4YM49_9VIBR|nr:gluconate operon transcriptional repressor GntR [Vibrio sp. KJ40-1]MDB1122611.1 gluconate operon transcriptional repressor GntR [Vibrio sp. KJ40-1]